MKVLIACEFSGIVREAFKATGHDTWSCDILDTEIPGQHIKDDVLKHLNDGWDLMIAHPPCNDLAVSGAKHFWYKREDGRQEKSIRFFFEVWKKSNCSENPIGILNGGEYIKKWFPEIYEEMSAFGFPFKPSQTIQPWMFGHGETKATCLWLKDLPLLKPTNIVDGREHNVWKMPPSKDRWKQRSKTYKGVAKALASQYPAFIQSGIKIEDWNKLTLSELNPIITKYVLLNKQEQDECLKIISQN